MNIQVVMIDCQLMLLNHSNHPRFMVSNKLSEEFLKHYCPNIHYREYTQHGESDIGVFAFEPGTTFHEVEIAFYECIEYYVNNF